MDIDCDEEPSPPTMDEYGEPSPLRVAFCNRVSEDEYEEQTSDATKKALDDLFATMEANPALYKRVLQRRKREEMENGGLFSYLKAQALVFVGREDAFEISNDECTTKISSMKTQMSKIYKYSEGLRETNGLKRSVRLKEKRLRQSGVAKSPVDGETGSSVPPRFAETTAGHQPPPAPPPPPPLPAMYPKGVLAPRPKIQYKRNASPAVVSASAAAKYKLVAKNRSSKPLSTLALQTETQQKRSKRSPSPTNSQKRTGGLTPSPLAAATQKRRETSPTQAKRVLRSNPAIVTTAAAESENRHQVCSLQVADIVDRRKHLKRSTKSRSPGGTPAPDKKQIAALKTPASLFNAELVNKFRNARLHSPSPTHSTNESFNESLDSSGWLSPDLPSRQRSLLT